MTPMLLTATAGRAAWQGSHSRGDRDRRYRHVRERRDGLGVGLDHRVDQRCRGSPRRATDAADRGTTIRSSSATAADVESAVDVVVHLGSGDHDARARRRENVTEGVDKSLAEAIARDANHLVFVSSAMVYGAWANNPIPLTEDAILRPDVEFVYARQLAAAEAMSDRWRRQRLGRTVTVLRPVVTMATDGTSHLARSLAAGLGQRFGEEDPPAQFLHLDDLASAVVLAIRRRLDGVFNVAPDGWIDGERVRALTGDRPRLQLPERAGRGARRSALAVPARSDPARAPQLHAGAVARRQRSLEGAGVGPVGHERAGLRRGHRGAVVDDDQPEAPPGDRARWHGGRVVGVDRCRGRRGPPVAPRAVPDRRQENCFSESDGGSVDVVEVVEVVDVEVVVDVDVVDEVDVVSAVESPVAAGSVDDSLGSVVSARIGASDDATTASSTDTSTASVAALTVESGGSGTVASTSAVTDVAGSVAFGRRRRCVGDGRTTGIGHERCRDRRCVVELTRTARR